MNHFHQNISKNLRYQYWFYFLLEHFLPLLGKSQWFKKQKQSNFEKIQNSLLKTNIGKIEVIKVDIENFNVQNFYDKHVKQGVPVVIKNGAKNWAAFKKWNFKFFSKNYGNDRVLIPNHYLLDGNQESEPEVTDLKTIIQNLGSKDAKYARFNPLLDKFPELQQDLDLEWIKNVIGRKEDFHALFIGSKGSTTAIHNAGNDNLFFQIRGKKLWYLWDAKATYFLNPAVNRAPAKNSALDPQEPDLKTFSAYYNIPTYQTILEEGDLLYVPAYCWHYVKNLEHTIGVAIRWTNAQNNFRNAPVLSILELFNTNPNIFRTMFSFRKKGSFDFNKLLIEDKNKRK